MAVMGRSRARRARTGQLKVNTELMPGAGDPARIAGNVPRPGADGDRARIRGIAWGRRTLDA
ncbi:hypothetical protein GCM10011583_58690 [Streptomyces camponoticapitis]|uniref:Uncharacterized protein n=1 Tax=Streptomyces camponoticapitis TaxID=1616125 RepID=A0ABQ2EPT7_9ACTN|nr:hypothetical protein GCM10011583_58690 [Streptomyces camponoticapitis]